MRLTISDILEEGHLTDTSNADLCSVLESPGIPVAGYPSSLKGYHNSLIDGSPSILVSLMG